MDTRQQDNQSEPEFRKWLKGYLKWRKSYLKKGMILCAIAVPVGLLLHNPYVWILGFLGLIIAFFKLSRMS